MDFGVATFDYTPLLNHDEKTNKINNHHGSGFNKQERSEPDHPPDQHPIFPTSKSCRIDYFHHPNKSVSMGSDANNMLSFSSTKNEKNQTSLFSFYQPSPAYIRNTGYGSGGGVHMPVSRYKGPFTPCQWMELEHQALIYKHFVANVPVPSHLLNPLRKSLDTFVFPGSSPYSHNSYGWGSFHLGFSGNTDPEPGRCRRTDGKKWRCSRDAVPDQKYCERHINRGRHRSRKPVEGQNGRAVPAPKAGPIVSPVSTTLGGGAAAQQNVAITSSTKTPIKSAQESQAFAINTFSIPKQHNPIKESKDYLMYPTNYTSFLDQAGSNPNPLPNFVDEWSKPDWTQLSMSSLDFSSSSNSPAQEKLAVALPGLSQEFDFVLTHKQPSKWVPNSCGNLLGGPLGEVLNQTSSNYGEKCKNGSSSAEMNHMTETWDAFMGLSPTGVLQKTALSNSSSGSSPKGYKNEDPGVGVSLCDELLLSTLAG